MKQALLTMLCMLAFSLTAKAQITIQSTNFLLSATAKDTATGKILIKTGASLPTHGNNQTWDYSAFRDSLPTEYYFGYVSHPVTTRPTAFATANLESYYNTFFQTVAIPTRAYYVNNTTGFGFLGDSLLLTAYPLQALTFNATDSIIFLAQSRVLNNILYYNKFPMTDKSSWTSTNKNAINFLLTIGSLNINKVLGQQVTTTVRKDTIVGWGTLKLRNPANGSVLNFNVLLKQTSVTALDSSFLGGQPTPDAIVSAFGLTQGFRDTTINYSLIGLNSKSNHLRVIANKSLTSVTNMFRAILPNQGLVSKNKEVADISVKSTVFPNPTTEGVNFEFDKKTSDDWSILIYNGMGQITGLYRVNAPQGIVNQRIALASSLPSGTYFYNLLDETSLIRANGKFLLNR